MHFHPANFLLQLRGWLHAHRPLAWVERCFASLDGWRPDPPVMDRLIR